MSAGTSQCPPFPSNPVERQQSAAGGIDGLINALTEHTEAMWELTHSNLMLSAAVAQLLEEDMGQPTEPQDPAKQAPESLDDDE